MSAWADSLVTHFATVPMLTTIHTAFNPADAHLVRSRLEAAGFHAVVMNELSALSMDGYSMAAGGILVQVPASEAAEAREFLVSSRPVEEEPGATAEEEPGEG